MLISILCHQHTAQLASMVSLKDTPLFLPRPRHDYVGLQYHGNFSFTAFTIACSLKPSAPPSLPASSSNTKIIPYPYSPSAEDSTLSLIDDVLNAWGRLDVWVCSSGLLGPPSITNTTPADLQKCLEANTYAPFFALKYAPPAMGKLCEKRNYPNAEVKDVKYGSIVVVGSVAGSYGGMYIFTDSKSCRVLFIFGIADGIGFRMLGTMLYHVFPCRPWRCAVRCCCPERYVRFFSLSEYSASCP